MASWRQLTLVHLTDLHFGDKHRFEPPVPPDGRPGKGRGWPTLLESLTKDWMTGNFADKGVVPGPSGGPANGRAPDEKRNPNTRVVIALTGDLTETAKDTEFRDARKFVEGCVGTTIFGWKVSKEDIFVVPGNHDLQWDLKTAEGRWQRFAHFYKKLRGTDIDAEQPEQLTRLIDQSDDGLIVAEINSSAYIEKDKENRGEVDQGVIISLRDELQKIDKAKRHRAIKVALVHHHPVLLPVLAEAKEGYSALVNSNTLLERLRQFGFHLILHGHKHMPYTFWYDPACAWIGDLAYPLMIAAGGTAGSKEIEHEPGATNTYNVITLRWDYELERVRMHIETRGLVRAGSANRRLDPDQWHWTTLRVHDQPFALPREPESYEGGKPHIASDAESKELEGLRGKAIYNTRRNFPAVNILPSLDPMQANEAQVRIEAQVGSHGYEPPTRVEWWAGPKFTNVVTVTREQDAAFRTCFSYYGPMLIQCRLHWNDGTSAVAHIFAPLPPGVDKSDSSGGDGGAAPAKSESQP
jgi:3',5'-cyclic AMP phosphodiesterase CpdA